MSKYIDVDRLRAGINQNLSEAEYFEYDNDPMIAAHFRGQVLAYSTVLEGIDSLQHEQPIEGKQVVIITETDGDANIHWDCRSLDDVKALLASAKSFIADKQIEELRGQGSRPDYNTTEGRFRNAHKSQQEQQMPDSTQLIAEWEKEKEVLEQKDFRGDAERMAYNAFLDGFVKGLGYEGTK